MSDTIAPPPQSVLVVDDEPVNIQLLKRKLEWDGLEVLTADNGQACLEIARANAPDLILLDVMMPGMDGFEVCQKLRENDATKSIPVIFVTAHNSKKGKLEGLEAGAVDYITKPIDLDETIARVRTQLRFLAINQRNLELTRRLGESRRAAAIGALTQGIAHNLNNLLGVVMGYLELAKANHADAEKVLQNLHRVEKAGNRIVGIIKQLSAVAFTTRLSLYEISLPQLLASSVKRAEEEAKTPLDIEVVNPLPDARLKTNVEAFEDMLAKLLLNAWESYEPLETQERPIRLVVEPTADESFLEFTVADCGSGIDPSVEEHMFEPFVSSKNTVGVGMGLTIVRHVVRALGGEIQLAPNPEGQGAVARFTHPLKRKPANDGS